MAAVSAMERAMARAVTGWWQEIRITETPLSNELNKNKNR
jgi:hypothetical protein